MKRRPAAPAGAALRAGGRPQLVELEAPCSRRAHPRSGLRPGRHAADHRLRRPAQDGHRARPPAARPGVLARGRALPSAHAGAEPLHASPAPRPQLGQAVRHLRIGPCFRRDSKGAEPPQRVHDAQPGRARAGQRGGPHAPRGARVPRHARVWRRGLRARGAPKSEVYGEMVDVLARTGPRCAPPASARTPSTATGASSTRGSASGSASSGSSWRARATPTSSAPAAASATSTACASTS